MLALRRLSVAALLTLVAGASVWPARADDDELARQQEKQRQIQAETDQVVRRIGTMLRVLEFYKGDPAEQKNAEQKLLAEVARTLDGLSQEQMTQVIARLEAAVKAPDPDTADKEVAEAYVRHREIITTLKSLLSRYDAVRDLAHVADKLDKLAQRQLDLHLQTARFIKHQDDRANFKLNAFQRTELLKQYRSPLAETKRQADEQIDLQRDLAQLLNQASALKPKLSEAERNRLGQMQQLAANPQLYENLANAALNLRLASTRPTGKVDQWRDANEAQAKAAAQIQELARALRPRLDQAAALREARDRIDQAIARQNDLSDKTKAQTAQQEKDTNPAPKEILDPRGKPTLELPGLTPAPIAGKYSPKTERVANQEQAFKEAQAIQKNQELAKDQARLEYDTRDTRSLLEPHAAPTAAKIAAAEKAMQEAKSALVMSTPDKAATKQEKAVDQLQEARKEVDKLIAAAEKGQNDPLAAAQKALESLDKVLKDQIDTRDQTKAAAQDKQNLKLPALAGKQEDLAKRTDALKKQPLPQQSAKPALDKAAETMKQATQALEDKKAPDAVGKQNQAIDALEQARKEVAEQIAEMQKRRDDMAKLEDAAKKLAELTKQENKIAGDAKDLAKQPAAQPAKDLGQKQEALVPQAKEVGNTLEKTVPDAAQKVADAGKQMDAAKSNLNENKPSPAAQQAKDAAQKLQEAQDAVARALNDLKGKELADQAAMNPKIDPQAAAQQIAKALEQAQKAAAEAQKAEQELAKANPMAAQQNDLAKLQAELAKQAEKAELPAAAKDASKAADALKDNAVDKAITQQEKALAKLQGAADQPPPAQAKAAPQSQPMTKSAEAKAGQPQASEAKTGESKMNPAQAKANDTKPGENKAGEPMIQEAKAGESKAGETKPGQQPAQTKANQAQPSETKATAQATPKAGESKPGEAKMGQTPAQAKTNQTNPTAEPKPAMAQAAPPKTGEAKTGQTKPGQTPAQSKGNEAKAAEAKSGMAKAGQPKAGQPKAGQAKQGLAKAGQPKPSQAKAGQNKGGQPQSAQAKAGQPKAGAEAKSGMAKAGEGKAGQGMQGESKSAQAQAGQGKAGQGISGEAKAGMAQAGQGKSGDAMSGAAKNALAQGGAAKGAPGQPGAPPSPAQLAEAQKNLLDATKAMAQSQAATQAAQAALGQAQTQAPQGIQGQLDKAGQQLSQAGQQLAQGQPGPAGQSQGQAAQTLSQALQAMNSALAAMGQPQVQPGQPTTAATSPMPGQGQNPGQGQAQAQGEGQEPQPGQGQGQGKGQAVAQKQGQGKGPAQEKNVQQGSGNRVADGKNSNAPAQMNDIRGEGGFLHLAPRERELVRQALAGALPPEYAAVIQQYYLNIARGRTPMPPPAPQR